MWYFVPRQGPARELIEAAGLEYAFGGVGVETTIVSGEPTCGAHFIRNQDIAPFVEALLR